jgi:tripartite-type tricarboxylate transporter receptor subunit TctC
MQKMYIVLAAGIMFFLGNPSIAKAAKEWDPTKHTIEIIVPYGPGGGTDRTARIVNDIFTMYGWKSIVINKPGNNSIIGTNYAAEAKPDGYTLFMGGDGTLDANFVFKNTTEGINYTENSFTPIVPLGKNGLILIAPKSSPVNTYDEFRTYVRRNPNRFNVGFWNFNQASTFLMWARLDGLPLPQIIVYKSSSAARADIVGGNLDFAFDSVPNTAQLYQSDKLKILVALTNEGVTEVKALNSKANIPDLSQKYPELNVYVWRGLYAPTGTSPAIVKEINQVINQGLKNKTIISRLASVDQYGVGGSSEQLHKTQSNVLNRYRNISKFIESMPQ